MDGNTTIVTQAADLAAYNGIAVATAMGNEGNGTPGTLVAASDGDSVIGCGAVDPSGILTWFSGWGPTSDGRIKPEVCAQGQGTSCADPDNFNNFTMSSGTSLSTPLIGGACGVLLSAHPNWTPMMVREALMMTADRADSANNEYGHGIIDVGRALYYAPAGDFVFGLRPQLLAASNQPIDFDLNITGGGTIQTAYLFWRNGIVGPFTQIVMTTQNGQDFTAQIPGQSGQTVQYYFKANNSSGIFAYHPLGDTLHPFSIALGGTRFVDSLDHGLLYWQSSGTNDYWGLSAKYSHSGPLSITESTVSNYRNNTDSYLTSRFALDLSHATAASFSFWWRGIMESNHDSLFVEISSQGGPWQRLPQFLSGSVFSFTQISYDLSSFFGDSDVRLRFHFKSDATGRREGAYIDDITIDLTTTGIDDENPLPRAMRLEQNYPNPFNPATRISFYMPLAGLADLAIFDLLGRRVRTLVSGDIAAGDHEITWDGRDQAGHDVASGVYVYRLQAGESTQARRMTLVR
jgi:hypothetical protein